MTDERAILDGIEALRAEMRPLAQGAKSMDMLRRDLAPRVEEAVRALIIELADVESDFQIEDFLYLAKKAMRNVRTFDKALELLRNAVNLSENMEPLIRQSVPVWISYLDGLEQHGTFTILQTLLGVLEKLAARLSPEEIERMSDGLVVLMSLASRLGEPNTAALLDRLTASLARVDQDNVQPVGPMGLVKAMGEPSVRRGLGLLLELTKALGGDAGKGQEPH